MLRGTFHGSPPFAPILGTRSTFIRRLAKISWRSLTFRIFFDSSARGRGRENPRRGGISGVGARGPGGCLRGIGGGGGGGGYFFLEGPKLQPSWWSLAKFGGPASPYSPEHPHLHQSSGEGPLGSRVLVKAPSPYGWPLKYVQ